MFQCQTSAQFKAYQWIKKNFEIECLKLTLLDSNTIQIKDTNKATANIQYKNNRIIIEYKDHTKESIKLSKEPCR